MTEKQVKRYIKEDIGMEPRHDCKALASAITDMAIELEHDECELMYLLLENMPINSLMTHSYGFHTANGRHIIETIKEKYYDYEQYN